MMNTTDILARLLHMETTAHQHTQEKLDAALLAASRFEALPEPKCDYKALAVVCARAHSSKIEAIKSFRAVSGAGLKDAKDAVEAFWK